MRGLMQEGLSLTQLVFWQLFNELVVPLAQRRGFSRHLHQDIQSDSRARKWIKGFAEYFWIFSFCEASSVVQSQLVKEGKPEPRPCSVLYKDYAPQKNWVDCQSAGDWCPCNVWEPLGHCMSCAALGLDIPCNRNWNQLTYIFRTRKQ